MTLLRNTVSALIGFALFFSLVPIAFAQSNSYYDYSYCNSYPYGTNYQNNTYPYNTNNYSYTNCPSGTLFVYVQVNQAPMYNIANRKPSDFTVSVAGQYVSQPTFPGSSTGTPVRLNGAYSVTAAQFQDYYPTYSPGCTGTLSNNMQATCVITENPKNTYPQYPYPQYPQYPQPSYPTYPTPPVLQPFPAANVIVTPTFVPSLPNTGFGPQDSATVAFAGAALIVVLLLSIAYVRKALAYIRG